MKTVVMKFGGTSVGSADAIHKTAKIVHDYAPQWEHLVVVVSAMRGVTDQLIQCAQAAVNGDQVTYLKIIRDLRQRHYQTASQLVDAENEQSQLLTVIDKFLDDLNAFCHSIQVMGEVTPRGMDTIVSLGERLNVHLVSAAIRQHGLDSRSVSAVSLILTDNTFQNAVPDLAATHERIKQHLTPLLEQGIIPVVTGFIGATADGVITTLGRGGSDYTAAILGAGLNADQVWTWTDVDGVMTADPRRVPNARMLPEISFNEISELAYFGANVLHPKTIRPIIERDIPLWVKNTFNPTCLGTHISLQPRANSGAVTAITAISDLSIVTVEGRGMLGVPGIAARTFAAVARTGASVLMISQASSEQSISFIIPSSWTEEVIRSTEEEMTLELARRDIDRIWAQHDVAIITVVGASLRTTPGVAARVFGALGKVPINVIAIAQGSSEYSISLAVHDVDATQAMQKIHDEVILNAN